MISGREDILVDAFSETDHGRSAHAQTSAVCGTRRTDGQSTASDISLFRFFSVLLQTVGSLKKFLREFSGYDSNEERFSVSDLELEFGAKEREMAAMDQSQKTVSFLLDAFSALQKYFCAVNCRSCNWAEK